MTPISPSAMQSIDHLQFELLVQRYSVADPILYIADYNPQNDLDRKLFKYSCLWHDEPLAIAFAASLNAACLGDYPVAILILAYYRVLQSVDFSPSRALTYIQSQDWLDLFYLSPQMLLVCYCSADTSVSASLRPIIDAILNASTTCASKSRATRQVLPIVPH